MKSTLVDVQASPMFRDSYCVLAYDNAILVYFCLSHVYRPLKNLQPRITLGLLSHKASASGFLLWWRVPD